MLAIVRGFAFSFYFFPLFFFLCLTLQIRSGLASAKFHLLRRQKLRELGLEATLGKILVRHPPSPSF
jgi:hypothetical protein